MEKLFNFKIIQFILSTAYPHFISPSNSSSKTNHCYTPFQHCGGEIKRAFTAKNPELEVGLAVRIQKMAAVKDSLIIRRARQTRGACLRATLVACCRGLRSRRASFATLRFAHAGRSPYV